MSIADSMGRQAREKAAAALSEPVLDAVLVNRYGTLSAILTSTAMSIGTGGYGGAWVPKDGIQRAGHKPIPLPHAFLLAVTANAIHVFTVRMIMGRLKVKKPLGVFERAGLQLAVEHRSMVTVFGIRAPRQRQEMTFEIMRSEYADSFAALLAQGDPRNPTAT